MTSNVSFQLSKSLAPGSIRVEQVKGEHGLRELIRNAETSLALAVLEANFEPESGEIKLEITGPPVVDFDTWLGMYLASRSLRSMISNDHSSEYFKTALASARGGNPIEVEILAGSLPQVLRLISYAQRERMGMSIDCPIPQRLSSLHRALRRLFPNDCKNWESAWDKIAENYKKHNNSDLPGRDPLFEGPFDGLPNSSSKSNWWLDLAVKRLQTDREAYERDLRRATRRQEIGYAMLPRTDGDQAPVEMIRVDAPQSLLFEVWAWEDVMNSNDAGGFPLVWIDRGWDSKAGFEIHLRPGIGYAPLTCTKGLNLSADRTADDGFSLFWNTSVAAEQVRVKLKMGFFAEDDAKFIDYAPKEEESCEKPPVNVCIGKLIRDSELAILADIPTTHPIKPDNWRLCTVKLNKLDIWGTWAGDEVARILYSALRPAPEMRLPKDFEDHISRDEGMVTVWTREGIAVAYEDTLPTDFEKTFKGIFQLRTGIQLVLEKTNGEEKDRRKKQPLLEHALAKQHAELRRELAQNSKLRALRSLFERTQPQELFNAWRDMSETEERLDAEDRHGYLEIGILVVYITELCDMLGRLVFEDHLILFLIGLFILAAAAVCVAYLLLQPRKPIQKEARWLLLLMLGPILVSIFFVLWTKKPVSPPAPAPAHSAPAAAGTKPSLPDQPLSTPSAQKPPQSVSGKHDAVHSGSVQVTEGPRKK